MTASTAATAFTLTGVPAIVTAGVSETFTLTAVDSLGAPATGYVGTVKFTTTDGKASIPANVSFSPLTGDSQTLHVTFKTAGPETLTATDTVSGIHGSLSVTVLATTVKKLVVSGLPASVPQGTAEPFTVTAVDEYGNTVTTYGGTVHFTSSDTAAHVPANYTFTTADKGAHSFQVTLETVGSSRSVIATDIANSAVTGKESTAVTYVAVLTGFTLKPSTSFTNTNVAGAEEKYTVAAVDQKGYTFAGFTGTVHFTSTDPKAVLPADTAWAGTHTFTFKFETAGPQTLTVWDTANETILGKVTFTIVASPVVKNFTVAGLATRRTCPGRARALWSRPTTNTATSPPVTSGRSPSPATIRPRSCRRTTPSWPPIRVSTPSASP